MKNIPVFYLPPSDWAVPFSLKGEEARHLSRVLRIKSGETIQLIDGKGREGHFKTKAVHKDNVELELLEEHLNPPPASRAIMAIAWNKSIRRGYFMEKAVELGASAIWFWQASRSQGKLPAEKNVWQNQLVAGAKQCGNSFIPEVAMFQTLPELARAASTLPHRLALWEETEFSPLLKHEQTGREGDTLYVIGPEGGISKEEIQTLRDGGFTVANLGPRIFRWETAAIYCLTLHNFNSIQKA